MTKSFPSNYMKSLCFCFFYLIPRVCQENDHVQSGLIKTITKNIMSTINTPCYSPPPKLTWKRYTVTINANNPCISYLLFHCPFIPLNTVGNYALSNRPKVAELVRGEAWELELWSPLSPLWAGPRPSSWGFKSYSL